MTQIIGMLKKLLGALLRPHTGPATAIPEIWPDLPNSGFISGRTAIEIDVDRGDAVFVTRLGGKLTGKTAPHQIPQFAYLIGDDGVRRPVVVVQAESNEQGTFFGLRDATGRDYVATEPEVELLGTTHP